MFLVPNRKKFHALDAFDTFFEDSDRWLSDRQSSVSTPISVRSDDTAVYIESEMPGISKSDLTVDFDNGVVTINAVKKTSEDVTKEDYQYSERSFGSISRSVRVGSDVDFDSAKAEYTDGVLHVTVPKETTSGKKSLKLS